MFRKRPKLCCTTQWRYCVWYPPKEVLPNFTKQFESSAWCRHSNRQLLSQTKHQNANFPFFPFGNSPPRLRLWSSRHWYLIKAIATAAASFVLRLATSRSRENTFSPPFFLSSSPAPVYIGRYIILVRCSKAWRGEWISEMRNGKSFLTLDLCALLI